MRCLVLVLTLFATMVLPGFSFGWGEDGHVIISKIAEGYLTPATRAAIKDLLDDRSISDPRLCTWADQIRRSAVYDRKYPKHDTWHYINIELKVKEGEFMFPEDKNHVAAAIERFCAVMVDPAVSKEDRKEALLFVIHFMQDLHQPLHCTNRDDDKGGNLQKVKSFLGKTEDRLNLHRVWDTNLVHAARGELLNDDFAKRLADEIKEEERKEWSKGSVRGWVWESHVIGVKTVYLLGDGTVLPGRDEPIDLTEENYVKGNRPIVCEQLKKGGVRLAQILNQRFDLKK